MTKVSTKKYSSSVQNKPKKPHEKNIITTKKKSFTLNLSEFKYNIRATALNYQVTFEKTTIKSILMMTKLSTKIYRRQSQK